MFRLTAQLAVVVALLCLAVANISCAPLERAGGRRPLDDAEAWSRTKSPGSPAARRRAHGDVLERSTAPIERSTMSRRCTRSTAALTYTSADASRDLQVRWRRSRRARGLYYVLASVGIFSLLVGAASASAARQPGDAAFLLADGRVLRHARVLVHGRLDTLDWVSTGRRRAMLLLPPLFVHFALVFPERPDSWARRPAARCRSVSAGAARRRASSATRVVLLERDHAGRARRSLLSTSRRRAHRAAWRS